MIVTAIVVAHAKRAVATGAGMPAAATALKNGGNTAVMTVDWNAEFAQSYIAQARRSGRLRPMRSRSRNSIGRPARDPFAQQRIDDHVARSFLEQHVLLDERRERRPGCSTVRQAGDAPRFSRVQLDAASWSTTARRTSRCGSVSRCHTASNSMSCSASSRASVRCKSSSVARLPAARPADARTSSHVSCASRCTSYGRLPARSTIAAPSPLTSGLDAGAP